MSAVEAMDRTRAPSPRFRARIAGVFYLLTFVTGMVTMAGRDKLGVYFDVANHFAALCYVVVTLLFYGLFKPVNRGLALLATAISLAGSVVGTLNLLHLAPFKISPLVFFGFYCLLIGYLILRSTFLPRILGGLLMFGGLGWLTFASPSLSRQLSPYNMLPGILGEGVLTVWLLVAGVDAERWKEQAGAAKGASSS